jgi:rubrerythrin
MGVDEAIKTAIRFETKVRDSYAQAAAKATDPAAKTVLETLRDEEQGHLDYLGQRLEEWKRSGKLTAGRLKTVLPSKEKIREGVKGLKARMKMSAEDRKNAEATLRKALGAEEEVGGFYKKMVAELPGEAQAMFKRFVEIEEGHLAIVQAELDSVTGLGFWFDVQEFRFEAE